MKEMSEDVLFSIAPYPLRIIEPVASTWAVEASKYTWWGRTELHIRDGDERRKHLEGLTTAIGVEIQQINERKKELLAERTKMKLVMDVYEEYQQKMREKEEEEAKLQKEVDEMRKKPVVRGALMHINTGKGRLSTGSGSASTPIVEPVSTPTSVPSPMLASFQIERPPLDFSRDSSPDGMAQSPPKDDRVMDEENKKLEDEDGI
jgi:hypothetical protein